jgi:predicted site-specific integrase-resolvase
MRKLLTAEQASSILQVSKQTLANWEKAGQIQTLRIGGIVRYFVDIEPHQPKGTAHVKNH